MAGKSKTGKTRLMLEKERTGLWRTRCAEANRIVGKQKSQIAWLLVENRRLSAMADKEAAAALRAEIDQFPSRLSEARRLGSRYVLGRLYRHASPDEIVFVGQLLMRNSPFRKFGAYDTQEREAALRGFYETCQLVESETEKLSAIGAEPEGELA